MNPSLKLTQEVADDIHARIKSLDLNAIEKIGKAKDVNGTFDVIISTEMKDRAGEIVKQDGWDLSNYKNNPIVLWGHDYYNLAIGVCTDTYNTTFRGVPALGARGVFFPADINPLAQQIRRMYEYGVKSGTNVGCTTSVGFIAKEFDENDRSIITRAELLEFSFVDVPANQGVGPAMGRSLTFDEAKELGLDTALLIHKGLHFVEQTECKGEGVCEDGECDHKGKKKDAEAGDSCTMDDGSTGQFTTDPKDPDGPLVCVPNDDDKSKSAGRTGQKTLVKALHDEHDRHTGEVDKAVDEYRTKAAMTDENGEKSKKPTPESRMRENLKDLRDTLRDEHDMHRAKNMALLRSFDPSESKSFDKKPHLKALRAEHDDYEDKHKKTLDEFEDKSLKSVEDGGKDDDTDWITDQFDAAARTHKKAVTKIAKAMCRDAYGEEDEPDEKTVAILKEFLGPHVDPQILTALTAKVGARISSATREKLREAHQHMKAATSIVEALHGNLGDDDGEEGRSDDNGKTLPAKAPVIQRSRPAGVPAQDALDAHLLAKEVLRGVTTAASTALERLNKEGRLKK